MAHAFALHATFGGAVGCQVVYNTRMASIPARYLTGLTGAARQRRIREILRERELGSFKPLPSDKGVKTKRSKWAIRFEREFGQRPRGVSDVARLTGLDRRILQQVYDKGLAAWSTGGHRQGASQHAWALARVQSFVFGGPTAQGPDRQLALQAGIL